MANEKKVSVILQAVDRITQPVTEINSRLKGFADGITGFFKGAVAGLAALGLTAFFKESVEQAMEAEKGWARLGIAVKNAGGDMGSARPEIEEVIKKTQRFSTATGDELTEALTRLITTTGDYKGSLANMGLVADVAAYKNISVSDAAVLVGKAMNGNDKAFKEFGITAGTNAEKMDQLRATTNGFAGAESSTFSGKLKLIANAWGDIKEAVGNAILDSEAFAPVLDGLVGFLASVGDWVKRNEKPISGFVSQLIDIGKAVGSAVLPVLKPFWELLEFLFPPAFRVLRTALLIVTLTIEKLGAKVQGFVGMVIEGLGKLGQSAKWVLEKIGIDLGPGVADKMAAAGEQMQRDSARTLEGLDDKLTIGFAKIVGTYDAHEAKKTEVTQQGANTRRVLTDEELKERERRAARFTKAVEEAEKLARSTQIQALSKFHGDYLKASDTFWARLEELQAAATEAGAESSEAHAGALKRLGEAQRQNAKEFGEAAIKAGDLKGKTSDLRSEHERLRPALMQVTNTIQFMTTEQLVATARSDDLRLSIVRVTSDAAAWAGKMLVVAESLGIADDGLRSMVGNLQTVADGIGSLNTGITGLFNAKSFGSGLDSALGALGSIGTVIGGIKKVLGGIFGKSEAEKKLAESLDRARVRIEELRDNIGDLNLNLTGRQVTGTQAALKEFFAGGGASQKGWGDRLGQILLSKGVSMSDLDEVAKTLNIELRPSGHLDPTMLRKLLEATGLVELPQYGSDFKSRLDEFGHQTSIFGWSPEEQARRFRDLVGAESPALQAALGGADFSTAEGRAAARSALQALESRRASGQLGNADLGGLTGGQFTAALEKLTDYVESLDAAFEEQQRQAEAERTQATEEERRALDKAAEDKRRAEEEQARERARLEKEKQDQIKRAEEEIAKAKEKIALLELTPEELAAKKQLESSAAYQIQQLLDQIATAQQVIDAAQAALGGTSGTPLAGDGTGSGLGGGVGGVAGGGDAPVRLSVFDLGGESLGRLTSIDLGIHEFLERVSPRFPSDLGTALPPIEVHNTIERVEVNVGSRGDAAPSEIAAAARQGVLTGLEESTERLEFLLMRGINDARAAKGLPPL